MNSIFVSLEHCRANTIYGKDVIGKAMTGAITYYCISHTIWDDWDGLDNWANLDGQCNSWSRSWNSSELGIIEGGEGRSSHLSGEVVTQASRSESPGKELLKALCTFLCGCHGPHLCKWVEDPKRELL